LDGRTKQERSVVRKKENKSSQLIGTWEPGCCLLFDVCAGRSLIYGAMGTEALLSKVTVENMANAFIYLANHNNVSVLWSLKEKDNLSDSLYEQVRHGNEYIKVVAFAPQVAILNDNNVFAFISHCGSSSTLEGILSGMFITCTRGCYNTPVTSILSLCPLNLNIGTCIVGIPQFGDQPWQAERLHHARCGINIGKEPQVIEICAAVMKIKNETSYHDNMKQMKEHFLSAGQ
jgi:UDP:flavonoid glycosyltransferase YjiC (YdhE family)